MSPVLWASTSPVEASVSVSSSVPAGCSPSTPKTKAMAIRSSSKVKVWLTLCSTVV